MVALAGCDRRLKAPRPKSRSKMIHLVVGPQAYHRLPEMVAEVAGEAAARSARDMPAIIRFAARSHPAAQGRPDAFLCRAGRLRDKFCTYCVVPYTRGAEISRPFADVVAEARSLVDGGALEITLLGQNVNAYEEAGSPSSIRADRRRSMGLERIRYTTSHPADAVDDLIAAHGEVDKLMPYLHLPVQSGGDPILKAMNRSHSR